MILQTKLWLMITDVEKSLKMNILRFRGKNLKSEIVTLQSKINSFRVRDRSKLPK
jgi:hypothetical protein